jgi:hypothetical protein
MFLSIANIVFIKPHRPKMRVEPVHKKASKKEVFGLMESNVFADVKKRMGGAHFDRQVRA